ncbi:hypothetical protein E4U21_004482 [Claviceps maximensis]|nr:hypothetical protein E4U21_004482 [Claviceps maximensis]
MVVVVVVGRWISNLFSCNGSECVKIGTVGVQVARIECRWVEQDGQRKCTKRFSTGRTLEEVRKVQRQTTQQAGN